MDCLSHTPNRGPGLQPRYVPGQGIEPVTFQFAGWCSIHRATPAKAIPTFKYYCFGYQILLKLLPSQAFHKQQEKDHSLRLPTFLLFLSFLLTDARVSLTISLLSEEQVL